LVHGECAEDIAQRLDVRIATVRSQIKDAMEKIGLHRQSDLVRHLSLALPALASTQAQA
jgi:DNA-binding CsgD family transcriptional regulator